MADGNGVPARYRIFEGDTYIACADVQAWLEANLYSQPQRYDTPSDQELVRDVMARMRESFAISWLRRDIAVTELDMEGGENDNGCRDR